MSPLLGESRDCLVNVASPITCLLKTGLPVHRVRTRHHLFRTMPTHHATGSVRLWFFEIPVVRVTTRGRWTDEWIHSNWHFEKSRLAIYSVSHTARSYTYRYRKMNLLYQRIPVTGTFAKSQTTMYIQIVCVLHIQVVGFWMHAVHAYDTAHTTKKPCEAVRSMNFMQRSEQQHQFYMHYFRATVMTLPESLQPWPSS